MKYYYHTYKQERDLIRFKSTRNHASVGETEKNVGELFDVA